MSASLYSDSSSTDRQVGRSQVDITLEAGMRTKRADGWLITMLVGGAALLVLATGCRHESPADHVSRLRAGYTATLNGFVVQQQPAETQETPEATAAEATAENEETAAPEAGAESASGAEAAPVHQNVMLDILIRNENEERLPGLTLDVSQADSTGKEKASWKVWVDTSGISRGPGTQVSHVLKDVDYAEGDGFNVEVRTPIPSAQRSEYREFTQAAGN